MNIIVDHTILCLQGQVWGGGGGAREAQAPPKFFRMFTLQKNDYTHVYTRGHGASIKQSTLNFFPMDLLL